MDGNCWIQQIWSLTHTKSHDISPSATPILAIHFLNLSLTQVNIIDYDNGAETSSFHLILQGIRPGDRHLE